MAGYWLGPITPERRGIVQLNEERLFGYEDFMSRLSQINSMNVDNDQIVILFMGESGHLKTNQEEEEMTKNGYVRDGPWLPDSELLEDVLDILKSKLLPTGWLIHVGIGSMTEWCNPLNPFKKDPHLHLKTLPTLLVWNTMKRISGHTALNLQNIITLLQD